MNTKETIKEPANLKKFSEPQEQRAISREKKESTLP